MSALDWKDCGDASFKGKIDKVVASPDPPVKGNNNTIKGSGTASVDVADGTFELVLKVDGVKLLDKKGGFCSPDTIKLPLGSGSMYFPGFPCPYKAGDPAAIPLYISLSKSAPPGATESILTATSASGDKLFCVDVKFKI